MIKVKDIMKIYNDYLNYKFKDYHTKSKKIEEKIKPFFDEKIKLNLELKRHGRNFDDIDTLFDALIDEKYNMLTKDDDATIFVNIELINSKDTFNLGHMIYNVFPSNSFDPNFSLENKLLSTILKLKKDFDELCWTFYEIATSITLFKVTPYIFQRHKIVPQKPISLYFFPINKFFYSSLYKKTIYCYNSDFLCNLIIAEDRAKIRFKQDLKHETKSVDYLIAYNVFREYNKSYHYIDTPDDHSLLDDFVKYNIFNLLIPINEIPSFLIDYLNNKDNTDISELIEDEKEPIKNNDEEKLIKELEANKKLIEELSKRNKELQSILGQKKK